MSCKNNKVPRSTKEIADFFNIKLNVMTKSCKQFQEMLKTNIISTSAEDFISRYCSKVNIDKYKRDICKQVANAAEEYDFVSENTPPSIAAASIYFCSHIFDWNVNKKELAEACEISAITITKCFKKLLDHKDTLINSIDNK
jgi:transcription initiation factor TFIIIB Brf1 subunit/transcription initiation factor TFIIB